MIERIFMASSTGDDSGLKDGQYKTAAEAEIRAHKLGWDWVVVYAHTMDDKGSGKVLYVKKRYYQPVKARADALTASAFLKTKLRTPEEVEQLRRELSTPDPKPLSLSEAAFFEEYERQMEAPSGKNP